MTSQQNRRMNYSQNLLRDAGLVRKLVQRSSIGADDLVLEIGPGKGILTRALAEQAAHVIAIEIDELMSGPLAVQLRGIPNITLFTSDARAFPLPTTPYKVFANVPYRITAEIVAKLTTGVSPPLESWLTVQREAAERFIGIPTTTLVSARLAPWFDLEIVHTFRRSDFHPRPAVDSVLLRVTKRKVPQLDPAQRAAFDDVVVGIFTAWTPTVWAALERTVPRRVLNALDGKLRSRLLVRPGQTSVDVMIEIFKELTRRSALDGFIGMAAKLERQQSRLEKDHRTRPREPHIKQRR